MIDFATTRRRHTSLTMAITIDAATKMQTSTCVQTQKGDMAAG